MFWSHENQDAAESIGRYVKDELRLRLRVAADFATLGAYGLLEDEDAPIAQTAPEAPPKHILLFAKVAPVCPHSGTAEPACAKRPGLERRSGRGRMQRRRGGSVQATEQPCLCAGERTSIA